MGKLKVEAQSTASRINAKTAAQTVTTTDTSDLARLNGELSDARDFNFAWAYDPHEQTGGGLLDLAVPGETLRDKPVFGFTGDWDPTRPGDKNVRSQLDSGRSSLTSSTDNIITYAFFTAKHMVGLNNNPGLGEGKGYTPFSAAQMNAARLAVSTWDDVIAPEFQEITPGPGVSSWAKNEADIWMANTFTGPAQAWAYYPGEEQPFQRVSGDVWIADPRFNGSNNELFAGGYGRQTLNHELGHAIGLSHPGDYNFGDDQDGDGVPDPITYDGDAFYFQDSHQYTIMSYFDSYETGNNVIDWNIMRVMYPSTPMVHDIWVAQAKYGVETTTRTGDTTYGFNSTSDVTNDALKFFDGERMVILTIWDSAGNDTLDLSGYYTPSIIDLREGAYSSAGGLGAYDPAWVGVVPDADLNAYLAFVNSNQADAGYGAATRNAVLDLYFGGRPGTNEGVPWSDIVGRDWLLENNIGIAIGAIIENAKGGHGDDRINGNQATNQFWGNDGADTFVMADYSGNVVRPTGTVAINDTSVDSIMDFDRAEGDVIDVSELGVTAIGQLSFDDATDTVTVTATGEQFKIIGASDIQASDFFFAS